MQAISASWDMKAIDADVFAARWFSNELALLQSPLGAMLRMLPRVGRRE